MFKTKNFNSWKFIKYVLVVFNFFASLSSLAGFAYTILGNSANKASTWLWLFSIIFFIVSFCAAVLFLRAEKYDRWKECLKYAKGFHKVLHCLRDMNKSLDNLCIRTKEINKEDFIRMITSDCINIVNNLSGILSDSEQCQVRVCVKLNDFIKEDETNVENMNLITFARSGYEGVNAALREHSKPIKVTENTDFEYIFNIKEVREEDSIHYFYQKNLKKYNRKLLQESNGENHYKNSDKQWSKKYNTTIVMPMRYLKSSTEKEVLYDIIGFLCIDAKKAESFENENFYFIIEFLKGISDIMYSYLNSCITYYNNINKKEE